MKPIIPTLPSFLISMRPPLIVFVICLALAGCVSSPLPKDYTGPTATVRDSVTPVNTTRNQFFWLEKVDGRSIITSPAVTGQKNHGRGLYMEPSVIDRQIPAQKVKLQLKASIIFAADILALTNKSHAVSGEVELDARPNKTYLVKGVINDGQSSVWIEDADTGDVVTSKIEKTFK